jgi:hypothetical protein
MIDCEDSSDFDLAKVRAPKIDDTLLCFVLKLSFYCRGALILVRLSLSLNFS